MPVRYKKNAAAWDKTPICFPATVDCLPGAKIILEIGPGRGDFLFHLAETNPDSEIIGVELKSKRYFKLIDRIKKRGLKNVRVIQDDARKAMREIFGDNSISEIHINFPDPWPKKRHKKNRLFEGDFIGQCSRILVKGGVLSLVTDADWYAEEASKAAAELKTSLSSSKATEHYQTFFAIKWQKEGRKIYCQKWAKV